MKNKNYFLWLSGLIIIVFLMQVVIPGFTELFVLNDRANNGEVWRFVSSIFLHGGVTHLLFNLVALLFFGIILEKKIGSKKFLIAFLASGILANLIAINYYDSSLGASGAIYGVMGCLTIITPLTMVWAFGLLMPISIASVLWIAADVLRSMGAFGETNIGSIAHLSGIAIGFILGIYWRIKKKGNKKNEDKIKIDDSDFRIWEDSYMR